ncbi:hypothetical protein GCM10010193_70640 [Kitasatospora atroaurantiaca]|uniref:Uncharacterized protein n=1 Tax=Kitasatospora atroaurantiaca TaxID=285545 RepID=A0A561ENH2_9ACTN|nr:hypothetical protein [Kitasatospora atroaurantiaca]TWE17150.1 hypothetical protein FB465_2155 [Kitasatospora atroaurantiaca]
MATIDPNKALPVYQARAGNMLNDIILRDIAIVDLEERNQQLEEENATLRGQIADLTSPPAQPAEY